MYIESHRHQAVDHMLDLFFLRAFLHYDNHLKSSSLCSPTTLFVAPAFRRAFARIHSVGLRADATKPLHAWICIGTLYLSFFLSPSFITVRSTERASSRMRSNRRRIAASGSGPGLAPTAASRTSFSRSG